MKNLFSILYHKMLDWSAHHHAPAYLAGVSFAESSFFPIPPDVMLISMGLAKPTKSLQFAFIATLFSVLGGLFGYVIGYFGMELIEPYLMASSYASMTLNVMKWFEHQGVWIVILAGFTPFPYKLFTITAGMMHMALAPFFIGSILGRGMRFFIVSAILYHFGGRIEPHLRRCIDAIGWGVIAVLLIGYVIVTFVYPHT